jgi:hypothetical protein
MRTSGGRRTSSERARIVLVLLAARYAAPAIPEIDPGDPECPCVDPWANRSSLAQSGLYDEEAECVRAADGSVCLPLTYGTSCAAWDDELLFPTCIDSDGRKRRGRPSYCRREFCYVDREACDRDPEPTRLFAPALAHLSYSYTTCGNLDEYTPKRYVDLLGRRTLRVSYPSDSGSGFTLITRADGEKAGSVVEFMDVAIASHQLSTREVEVSKASRKLYPLSSFTACVHDVALNRTDICLGNFWVRRRARSPAPRALTFPAPAVGSWAQVRPRARASAASHLIRASPAAHARV